MDMDMTPMTHCGPSLLEYLVVSWLILFFPVGAIVLRPLRAHSGPAVRALTGLVTILGLLMSPSALLLTAGTALRILFE
jgi:uncharacterized membrane protein YhaH (DUF805 family)